MLFKDLLTAVTIVTLLQVVHCFEEIGMNAHLLYKKRSPKNPRGFYLRSATALVTLNFVIILLLISSVPCAPYLCFYTVFISIINSIIHIVGWIKAKSYMGTLGAGVFSGVPLGIAGCVLLYILITVYL